jgi:hypothetical protein
VNVIKRLLSWTRDVHLTVTSGPLTRIPTNAIHAAALGAATSNAPLLHAARVHDWGNA